MNNRITLQRIWITLRLIIILHFLCLVLRLMLLTINELAILGGCSTLWRNNVRCVLGLIFDLYLVTSTLLFVDSILALSTICLARCLLFFLCDLEFNYIHPFPQVIYSDEITAINNCHIANCWGNRNDHELQLRYFRLFDNDIGFLFLSEQDHLLFLLLFFNLLIFWPLKLRLFQSYCRLNRGFGFNIVN